jgi:hypothetical protein
MKDSLRDRYGDWAIVTGASSGIGREMALQLAARGLKPILVARSASALEALAAQTQGLALPLDLSAPHAPSELLERLSDRKVGLLVNAAGFGSGGAWIQSRLPDELSMLDVNCRAVLELSHFFARQFAAQRRGGIVLLSSIVSYQGVPFSANYAATKAYIQSLGEALAEELAPYGVDVLTAAPGPTASGFAARAGMVMKDADSSARVAAEIVSALGRRSRVVPGARGKFLTAALSTAPRFLRVKIMKAIMQGMTR